MSEPLRLTDTDILDRVESEIRTLAAAVQALDDGPLTERAIVLLLKDQSGLNMSTVKRLLWAIRELPGAFLKDEEASV